jgi:hypothetical protein
MKKTLYFSFILIFVVTIVAFCTTTAISGANPKGKPFVAIQGQIVEVKGEIQSIKDQIANITSSVSSIAEAVQQAQTDITELQTENDSLQTQITELQTNYANLLTQYSDLVAANEAIDAQITQLVQDNAATQEELDALAAQSEENTAQIEAIMGENGELALLAAEMENLSTQIQSNSATMDALGDEVLPELQRLSGIMDNILAGKCSNGQAVREILPDGTLVCESGPLLISPGASWPGEMVQVESSWYPTAQTETHYQSGTSCYHCGQYCYSQCKYCCWYEGWFQRCGRNCSRCGSEQQCYCRSCTWPVTVTTYPYSEFSLSLTCPSGHILTQWGYQAPFAEDTVSENHPTITVDTSGNAIPGYTVSGEHAESSMQTYVTANATCMAMP